MGGRSSKKKSAEAPAPLDFFVDGAIIFLKAKASSKLLQFHEGNVNVSSLALQRLSQYKWDSVADAAK